MIPAPQGRSDKGWRRLSFLWGAAEASLFFIVPDLLIGWLALSRGWRAGGRAVAVAAFGAVVGGVALFVWSERAPGAAMAAVKAVPAVSDAMVEAARTDIQRRGWVFAALSGPSTSTPFKVYAVLAPHEGVRLWWLALTAMPIRLPRFALAAFLFGLLGLMVRRKVSLRLLLFLYAAGWIAFYLWFFTTHSN